MEMIWGDGSPPLFELVAAAIRSRGDTPEALQVEIEDSKPASKIRFVAGAVDALFGSADKSDRQVNARKIVAALTNAIKQPSRATYALPIGSSPRRRAMAIVDEVLGRMRP